MYQMNDIAENRLVDALTRLFVRSPYQLNGLHQSDAELVQLPGANMILACKTDSIVEEIESGLYSDPYLIGWMTVTANASDLAAVGADPVGILLSETLPPDFSPESMAMLQNGIKDACEIYGLSVLGGDTNSGRTLSMGATIIGAIPGEPTMSRVGCWSGDVLFSSGLLGLGSAFAFTRLSPRPSGQRPELRFMPVARLNEGRLLRRFATCCMDTSDGAIATLDQLMRLNDAGIELDVPLDEILHPAALKVADEAGFPHWLLLAGPHGEFELIFAVPPSIVDEFQSTADRLGWHPIRLGAVVGEPGMRLTAGGKNVALPTAAIRNLFGDVRGNVGAYVEQLLALDRSLDWAPADAG